MSLLAEKGTFTLRTTAGSQTVTLANGSLTPKVVFLWTTRQTATGYADAFSINIGATTASGQDWAHGTAGDDAAASTNTTRRRASTRVLHTDQSGAGTANLEIDTTSFAAGNFIINVVANALAGAYLIHYLVIGGSDLTNVRAGEFNTGTATGNVATTVPGFQPDVVLFSSSGTTATSTANGSFMFGMAKSSSERFYSNVVWDDANAAGGNNGNVQKSTACCGGLTASTPGTQDWEADFVSMDANGFTINITDAPTADVTLNWVAMKFTNASMCDIGVETQNTSAASKSTTGLSVIPKVAIFGGGARAASASIDTGATSGRFSFGASDGSAEGGVAVHDTDGSDPTVNAMRFYDTKAFATMTANATAGSSTTTGEADCSFSASDGQFDLNWTTSEGTAREFLYFVAGDTLPGGGGGTVLKDVIGRGVIPRDR